MPHADRLVPMLLAGGSGTRLWPVSRAAFPKHLVELFGEESLLQTTAKRALAVAPASRLVTVAAAGQAILIRRQYQALDPALLENLILEPSARNTAAAIAIGAMHVAERFGDDAILWVCPSDHLMQDTGALYRALEAALAAAADGWLVTFGVTPLRPETGFGWIEAAESVPGLADARRVARFVEKPQREVAERLLADGNLWNSGMFVLRADRVLDELARHEPELLAAARAAFEGWVAGGRATIDRTLFDAVKSMPIDKAVMERSDRVATVPFDPRWSDVGSWHAIWELMEKDADGNARQGDTISVASSGNLVRSERRVVALAGVRDLAVIETADAVLVADRQHSDGIRGVVAALVEAGRPEAVIHAREVRPWGTFTVLHSGPGVKVKEVVVDPGQRLTRQVHHGRDEHWVIVAGAAEVELGDTARQLAPGDSIRVPRGTPHRLANLGHAPLRLIETGLGTALGDDDTVRLHDAIP